jgi:RNA polymerase subunit RPABC4/transcription elongation factor Spt4
MGATTCWFSILMADDAKALADGLRRRDPELLDRLIEQYQYRLFRYLVYLTGSRETAEDCKYNLRPTCPQCKREVGETDRYCPHCASELPTTKGDGGAPSVTVQTSADSSA